MIKLDGIIRAVEKMTDALNNLASAINRAATLYESSKTQNVIRVEPPPTNTGGYGQGW